RSKTGIQVLPNGIQYRVIEAGNGRSPTPTSEVSIHYRGSLAASGLEFDSSFARGQPVTFKVDEVLRGWQEVLPRMKVGDHWQVFLPPEMAYGERGQPPVIGPNEALAFDIKPIEVKSAAGGQGYADGAERSAPSCFPAPGVAQNAVDAPATTSAIASPCVGVCTLDARGCCIGCLRTLDEIAAWGSLDETERRRLMDEVLPLRETGHGGA